MTEGFRVPVEEKLAREISDVAADLARGAGEILAGHFGRRMTIEYKDKAQRDPVTPADKTCQEFLSKEIAKRFPDHGILGEEGADDDADANTPAPDFTWVLDPLDGTTNFLNGLPLYASSIGVLYRGRPLAGALFVPWPKAGGGFVLRCRQGCSCFADDEPVSVYKSNEPAGNRLIGLPGSFHQMSRFSSKFGGNAGEMRITGSIAYELAMTACGVDAVFDIRSAPNVGYVGRGAGGDGSPGHCDDQTGPRETMASPGVPGARLGN